MNSMSFCYYLEVHENILSDALGLEKVKEIRFKDFPEPLNHWGRGAEILCWRHAMSLRKR